MTRLDLLKGVCGSSARKCVTNGRPEVLVAFGTAKDRPNLPLGARVRLLRTWLGLLLFFRQRGSSGQRVEKSEWLP